MNYFEIFNDYYDNIEERFELVSERMSQIKEECDCNTKEINEDGLHKPVATYFSEISQFLVYINNLYERIDYINILD